VVCCGGWWLCHFVFSALTLGCQKEHLACKEWVLRCLHGYLSGARCKWFAYGPADATATPSSHHDICFYWIMCTGTFEKRIWILASLQLRHLQKLGICTEIIACSWCRLSEAPIFPWVYYASLLCVCLGLHLVYCKTKWRVRSWILMIVSKPFAHQLGSGKHHIFLLPCCVPPSKRFHAFSLPWNARLTFVHCSLGMLHNLPPISDKCVPWEFLALGMDRCGPQ